MKLPYTLPEKSTGAQEMVLSVLLALVGASFLVSHWFAARAGYAADLGWPLLAAPELRLVGLGLVSAAGFWLLFLVSRKPSAPATWVLAVVLLPVGFCLLAGRLYSPLAWMKWRAELVTHQSRYPALVEQRQALDKALLIAVAMVVLDIK